MTLPDELIEVLAHPVHGAASLHFDVSVGRRFRAVVLLELALALLSLVLIVPVVILAVFSAGLGGGGDEGAVGGGSGGGGGGGGGSFEPMFGLGPGERGSVNGWWNRRVSLPTLQVDLRIADAAGTTLAGGTVHVEGSDGYDALLGSMCAIARLHRLPLTERLLHRDRPIDQRVFHGEHPLGVPSPEDPDALAPRLPDRMRVDSDDRSVTLTCTEPDRATVGEAVWQTVAAPFRKAWGVRDVGFELAEAWRDVLGVSPREHRVELRADGVRYLDSRAGVVRRDQHVGGGDLCAIDVAGRLSREPGLVAYGPTLRVLGRRETIWLPGVLVDRSGLVERFLQSAVRDLQTRWPEAALGHEERVVRCPACEVAYDFRPDAGCPRCGAPPGIADVPAP